MNLSGTVQNAGGSVILTLFCDEGELDHFVTRLQREAPSNSRIDRVVVREESGENAGVTPAGFRILSSGSLSQRLRFLPPDLPVCQRCVRELTDRKNRRYRYPLISCTACGPRYTILEHLPYDRENTTMRHFPMCPDCRREYREPGNHRRHAQTISCHHCGPQVALREKTGGQYQEEEALNRAVELLNAGKTGAVKDIGGYHLVCLPTEHEPVERLRKLKARERKPFAVMFPDMASIRECCRVSAREEKLLQGTARPIVLLERRKEKDFDPAVGMGSRRIGAMLPCNPLQILLLQKTGPLVMTSGNRSGEPMIIRDKEMLRLMEQEETLDFVLYHNREILCPLDDSVFQVTHLSAPVPDENAGEAVQIIRRARGIVPEPLFLDAPGQENDSEKSDFPMDCLAEGGDLKAVFGLVRDDAVYLSGQFGDLGVSAAAGAREQEKGRMEHLLDIHPVSAVTDLHPGYRSVRTETLPSCRVQHHVAHMASVLAEHHLQGPCIGAVFDGTGYGVDGTVWGGEFFISPDASEKGLPRDPLCGFHHAGSLRPVLMAGGDGASKKALLPLCSYLHDAVARGYLTEDQCREAETGIPEQAWHITRKALAGQVNCIPSSSMGRLFDAAAFLTGVCQENSYEGECPGVLEGYAESFWQDEKDEGRVPSPPPFDLREMVTEEDSFQRGDGSRLLAEILKMKQNGAGQKEIAFRFHQGVAGITIRILENLSARTGIRDVVLSGGTFYNGVLLKLLLPSLRRQGMKVWLNEKVPCGDGGLALGQAWLIRQGREGHIGK